MAAVVPRPVRPGDRVAIVAPSGPFPPTVVWRGLAFLRERYRLVFDRGLFARKAYLAGDDVRRRRELARALEDDDITAILAARGGYGANRLAEAPRTTQVDRRLLRHHRPPRGGGAGRGRLPACVERHRARALRSSRALSDDRGARGPLASAPLRRPPGLGTGRSRGAALRRQPRHPASLRRGRPARRARRSDRLSRGCDREAVPARY